MFIRSFLALAATLVTLGLASPTDAKTPCSRDSHACRAAHVTAKSRDWALHRPSTPRERAETRRLNREFNASGQAEAGRVGRDATPYRRDLLAYQQAQRRYEQDMRRYQQDPRNGRIARGMRDRSAFAPSGLSPRAKTGMELDNDPYAPTGGVVDSNKAAPTPGLDGASTGLTQFNDHASGRDRGYGNDTPYR